MDTTWQSVGGGILVLFLLVAVTQQAKRAAPTVGPDGELEMRFSPLARALSALLAFALPIACTIPTFQGTPPDENWGLLAAGAVSLAFFGFVAYCLSAPVVTVKDGRIVAELLFGRHREMLLSEIDSVREAGGYCHFRSRSGTVLKLSLLLMGMATFARTLQDGIVARDKGTL